MSGFFSRIIGALLGEKEEKRQDHEKKFSDVKIALLSPPHASSSDAHENYEGQSTIYKMIARAYRRIAVSLAQKSKNRHTLAVTGVAFAVLITILSQTSFFFYLRGTVLAIIFILIAAMSKFIQKFFTFVVGFDMCLFFTVLVGIAYHPIAGIIVGVLSSTLGSVIRGQYDMTNVILPNLGYIAAGILLPFFAGSSIIVTGMALTLVYASMMSVIFWFVKHSINNTATFVITSLIFNYLLFSSYSAYFLKLMGA